MSKDNLAIIRTCQLFDGASDECLKPLVSASSIKSYEKGVVVFSANDEADGLRIILKGSVRVSLGDSEGRELTLALMSEGECFGEIALLDGQPRTANVVAAEHLECLFLPGDVVQKAIENDPKLTQALVLSLCKRMRRNMETIGSFAFVGLGARLAQLLIELSESHAEVRGGKAQFTRRFSQAELASLLGVTREAVNKRFKALQYDQLVDLKNSYIVIPNIGELKAQVGLEEDWAENSS